MEPQFFGSTYAAEAAWSDDDWIDILKDSTVATWGLYYKGDCVGMTRIGPFRDTKDTLILRASYIRKEYRGMGLSALFYRVRIDWAKERGYRRLLVSHRVGNAASGAANQKFGFKYSHTDDKKWPDGKVEGHLFYELLL